MSVEDKIVTTLLELRSIGLEDPETIQVCKLSGYSNLTSAGFHKAKQALLAKGFICYPSKGTVSLTEEGAASLSVPFTPPTCNAEIQERIKETLKKNTSIRMFNALCDGKEHDRKKLMVALGYSNPTSAGFAGAIKHLKSLKMIENPSKGTIRLSDAAFPFGRSAGPTPATP